MTDWFTADLHLGHTNIIKYCHRPFTGIALMNHALIANWNSCVRPKDVVYVLGDFGLALARCIANWVKELHGTKILIRGNHDISVQAALRSGFAEVHDVLVYNKDKLHVLLCHYPIVSHYHSFCLHGHTHQRSDMHYDKLYNVGVDLNDFKPLSWNTLKRKMQEVQ